MFLRPGHRRLQRPVLPGRDQAQVVDALGVALARDDVDGAGDGACAGLGGRRAQDLDALDLVGRERVEREARRHALAVEQDLGVAVAEAAQPDRAAAAGAPLDRHAGQALEHVAERRVAEAVDLLATDDDLGRGRPAPLLDVVGAAAGDLHRSKLVGARRGGRDRCALAWRGRSRRGTGVRALRRGRRRSAQAGSGEHERRGGTPGTHELARCVSMSSHADESSDRRREGQPD